MDFKEKNFKLLKEFRPEFYDKVVEGIEASKYSEEGIEYLEARDGSRILSLVRNGKTVRLNSMYRPIQEAKKWTEQYEFQNLHISVLMFGIGNGTFIREMLKKLDKESIVILYEPDFSVFVYQLYHQDFSDIIKDERIFLFVKEVDEEALYDFISRKSHWSILPSRIVCHHPGYDTMFAEECLEFKRSIKYINEVEVVNRNTLAALSHALILNTLKSLHFIRESNYIGEFIDVVPEDIPAIIVSAGPSLDKNIEQLRKAVGHALIVATDTSVKYLLQHDVPFDVMVTVDPRKGVGHIRDPKCAGVPIFAAFESRNEIMEFHTGRKIWVRSSSYIENLYARCGRVFPPYHPGGSVATAAFQICRVLGVRQIVLIGQDLAYSGTTTHAGGVKTNIHAEKNSVQYVKGIDGKPVLSRGDWVIYKKWFEDEIKQDDTLDVIDATEGGALIEGAQIMALSDVIEEHCKNTFVFQEIVDAKKPTFTEEEYQKVKAECETLHSQFMELGNKAREGIKVTGELLKMLHRKEINPKKENKKVAALRKINSFIEEQPANELLEVFTSDKTAKEIQKVNKMSDDDEKNMIDTLEISKVVYREMLNGIDVLDPVLEESLKKM